MRHIRYLALAIPITIVVGCSQTTSNKDVSGNYIRLDSNQYCRIKQTIKIEPATDGAQQEFTVIIKSLTDYFDERPDKVSNRPSLHGKLDVKTGILQTNDPGIVIYFDHKKNEVKLNKLILTKQ